MKPKLSVVLANYNHGDLLPRAMDALLREDYNPMEIIVVDDGSTDKSREILEGYRKNDQRVRLFVNEKNRGSYYSITRARGLAEGDYVYSAASDDYVMPGFLTKAMDAALAHPEAGLICGKMRVMDGGGIFLGSIEPSRLKGPQFVTPEKYLKDYLLVETPMHSLCSATVYKRAACEAVGGLREELGPWRDGFMARTIGIKYGIYYVDEVCVAWTLRKKSFSQNNYGLWRWRNYRRRS